MIAAAYALISGLSMGLEKRSFAGANLLLVGMLVTGSAAFFPVMLYSTLDPANSLTAYNAAAGPHALLLASFWWPLSFVLALFYFIFILRYYAGKISGAREASGTY